MRGSLGQMARQAISAPLGSQQGRRRSRDMRGPGGSNLMPNTGGNLASGGLGAGGINLPRARRSLMGLAGSQGNWGATASDANEGPRPPYFPGGQTPTVPGQMPPNWTDPQGNPYQTYPTPGQDYPTGGVPEPTWGDTFDNWINDWFNQRRGADGPKY